MGVLGLLLFPCWAGLLLPNYANRERLKDRLFLAMEHGKGFGLA